MNHLEHYVPGPAFGAQAEKASPMWKLILVREFHHPPEKVWQALTNPAHLREWAPFEADGNLDAVGNKVKLTWTGTGNVTEAEITRAEAPRVLEFQNMRWELQPLGDGTRITLWHGIPPRYISWGAAGWHICFDVLDRLLKGTPIPRIAGPDAMHFSGFQRLVAEYSSQFGSEPPNWAPKPAQES